MVPEESRAGSYDHRLAWLGGVLVAGLGVVTVALCGTIAVLVRAQPMPAGTDPIGGRSPDVPQYLGLAILLVAALGYALSHAASQEAGRLPSWTGTAVGRAHRALARVPILGALEPNLTGTKEVSRFVSVIGPFLFSAVAAPGVWLATDLGARSLFLGGALAGAAAAGAAILVEPLDTSIQSGGMFVALVVGAIAAFGWWSPATVIVVGGGALWIMVVADVTDAIVKGIGWVTFMLVGIAVAATAVLSELDNTLASLTVSGRQPRSFADLAPLLEPHHAPARVREVADTWLGFRDSITTYVSVSPPSDYLIRSIYAFVDSAVFAVAYSLLLIALTNFLLDRLSTDTDQNRLRSILTVTKFAVPVLFLLDVGENVSGAASVLPYSRVEAVNGAGLDGIGGLATLLAVVHWTCAAFKWVTVLGAAVAIGATALTLARARGRVPDGERSPVAQAVRLVRAHIVLVVVLALALRNRQAFDAIRRLARGDELAGTEVLALAVVVIGCACAIRYLAELIGREAVRLDAGVTTAMPSEPGNPTAHRFRSAIDRFIEVRDIDDRRASGRLWHGALAAALALVMALFLGAAGALIPVAMWLVLELLSIPLRPVAPVQQRIGAEHRRNAWMRRVAVAVAIVVVTVVIAWILHLVGGAAAVRWLLIGAGIGVAVHALTRLIPPSRLRATWLGLAPAARAGLGLVPLFTRLVPSLGRSIDQAWDWLIRSILRRLLNPLIWLLRFLSAEGADRLSGMLHRAPSGPAPTAPAGAAGDSRASGDVDASDAAVKAAIATATTKHAVGIARVLGGLVPVLVGAALIRSALGLALYDTGNRGGVWLILLGIGFVAIGPLIHSLPTVPTRAWGQQAGIAAVRLAIASVFVLYLIGWQVIDVPDVIAVTRRFGAVGVVCLALALFALIATVVSYLIDATSALPALQLLRIRRVPFYGFAIVWLLIAGMIDDGGYHNIDTQPAIAGSKRVSVSAEAAFTAWATDCAATGSGREAVPMVFVAASGGGIRAAYWTATALEKFDGRVAEAWGGEGPCTQPIFAASGASGGSVGLSSYAVNHLASDNGTRGVRDRLDDDYLSPTVAWFLMADLVRPFFLWDIDGDSTVDRARVLELAWEDSWQDLALDPAKVGSRCALDGLPDTISLESGLRETWCLGAPLLMLNGAEVNSACRFNTSVLDNRTLVGPADQVEKEPPTPTNCLRPPTVLQPLDKITGPMGATVDLPDYLCADEDISMSTAALLSARFPFVSPSGRVEPCDGGLIDDPSFVVDGGYIDNSGASSVVELWAEVSAYVDAHNATPGNVCIVPVFLQLDNGYDFDTASRPGRPSELVVPLSTALGARGSREAEAKQVAANIFTSPNFSGNSRAVIRQPDDEEQPDEQAEKPIVRWTRIVPEAHPGVQAPLGWVLSEAATADLDAQLAVDAGFGNVDQWLDDDLACVTPS